MLRCGSAYCPAQIISADNITDIAHIIDTMEAKNDNFTTDITKIYIIAGIFLFCSISSALIIVFFVDPLTRFVSVGYISVIITFPRFGEDERKEGKEKLTGTQLLVATFRHMKKKNQILIIPLTFWSGVEQGFFGADFTAVSIGRLFIF